MTKMNEDIKRILDTLKEYYGGLGWPYYPEDVLNPEDPKIIYDYITKLQNNWNELKKWLEENKHFYNITGEDLEEDTTIKEVLNKMQELQGDDKN